MKRDNKHDQLQTIAIEWLHKNGCSVFAKEVQTWNGIADIVGVKTRNRPQKETVYYIEAKTSRSDLLSRKQRSCYAGTENIGISIMLNDIDLFYFIVADGVKIEPSLYPLWGVINERGKVVRKAKRMEKGKGSLDMITSIAHVLVYKVYGKLYLIE